MRSRCVAYNRVMIKRLQMRKAMQTSFPRQVDSHSSPNRNGLISKDHLAAVSLYIHQGQPVTGCTVAQYQSGSVFNSNTTLVLGATSHVAFANI